MDAGELSPLQQLIIRPGEEGGIITQTEFMFSMFCAEEKLKKKTSDRLISMIKRHNFVIEDIRAETIRELTNPTRTPSSGLQVPDIPDLGVLPVFKKKCPLPPSLCHDCDCR